jgi:uroporphyrinogen-III decarboxylase
MKFRLNVELQATAGAMEELREEMQSLLTELTDLSARNDELMIEKDADLVAIRDLEAQVADYRRKYERAKTDLRNIKGALPFD